MPHSKSSVFYQAIPAVGADGQNIMKLIPVQKTQPITVFHPFAAAQSAESCGGPGRAQIPATDLWPKPTDPVSGVSMTRQTLRSQTVKSLIRNLEMVDPSAKPPHELPVTVKSPVLPRGHCLKIPPNAQVQRVPLSELPLSIKDQIFPDPSDLPADSGSPTVVYVTPVTTEIQAGADWAHSTAEPPEPTASTPYAGSLPVTAAKNQLRLVPMVSNRPNSPARWVIEDCEGENATESSERCGAALTGTQNALLMYNGRVFFVGQKGSSSFRTQSGTELKAQLGSDEVIDLCDDDDDPPPLNPPAASYPDEDNVIFVSYVPPKAEPVSGRASSSSIGHSATTNCAPTHCPSTCCPAADGVAPLMDTTEGANSRSEQNTRTEGSRCTQPEKSFEHLAIRRTSSAEHRERSDRRLRRIFGITSDVRISLQKADEVLHTASLRSWKGGGKLLNVKKALQELHCPEKVEPELPSTAHGASTKAPPVFKESCCSVQRASRFSTESVIGYVEPIEEDFPDECDIPKPQEDAVHPQLCREINVNTRRVGRTRKRTMCPCCVPAALHSAVKSGVMFHESELWWALTEQPGRRPGRTKASRKDGRTAARIRYRNCEMHKAPGSDGMSTDSDELKTHEQNRGLHGTSGEEGDATKTNCRS